VIMVAERISDLVLGKAPLPPAKFDGGCEPWKPLSLKTDRERDLINH
jgi:hypothetical protein